MKKNILSLAFIASNLIFVNAYSMVSQWQRAECEEKCEQGAFCRPGTSTYNNCLKKVNDCKDRCRFIK